MSAYFKRKPSKEDLLAYQSPSYQSPKFDAINIGSIDNETINGINMSTGNDSKPQKPNAALDLFVSVLGIDLRSLALLRVGMGILIMLDVYVRGLYLHDHYTDLGAVPSNTVIDNSAYLWSLYYINSSRYWAGFLFIVNFIAAFSMAIGFKTRISAILCWILMTSIHVRNPYVLNGGDDFFRLILWWMLFLPIEAKASIDATLNVEQINKRSNINNAKNISYSPIVQSNSTFPSTDSNGKYYLSMGTIAIMAQFCIMYLFTALLKTGDEWNVEYSAVWYALNLDQFATPIGVFLRQFIVLGQFLTWFTIWFEWFGFLLFFIPFKKVHGPLRTLGVLMFWCLHIGFGSCLQLGFFMYIPGVAAFMFLPSWFWDNLLNYLYNSERTSSIIYFSATNESLYRVLSIYKSLFLVHTTPLIPAQREDESINLQYEDSIYNEMKSSDSWLAIEDATTLERKYGYNAFVELIRLSPLLKLLSYVFATRLFKKFYTWLVNRPLFISGSNWNIATKLYPTKPVQISRSYIKEIAIFLALIFVINWNFAGAYNYAVPESIRWVGPIFKIDQYWSMFSPYPSKDDGWLVYPGTLSNGKVVDIFRGGAEVTYDKPALVSEMFPTQRWRKFLMNLEGANLKDRRLFYGRYLCREWNWYGRHQGGEQLQSFKIIYMLEMTPPFPKDGIIPPDPEPTSIELWSHSCF